jgi:hypothetical protein
MMSQRKKNQQRMFGELKSGYVYVGKATLIIGNNSGIYLTPFQDGNWPSERTRYVDGVYIPFLLRIRCCSTFFLLFYFVMYL